MKIAVAAVKAKSSLSRARKSRDPEGSHVLGGGRLHTAPSVLVECA